MVDDAREFITIADSSIHPPNEAIAGLSGNYVAGIATLGERIVLVLDIREVVATTPTAAA
jgi:purine-binding chemotaxis protein CheW